MVFQYNISKTLYHTEQDGPKSVSVEVDSGEALGGWFSLSGCRWPDLRQTNLPSRLLRRIIRKIEKICNKMFST